MKIHDISIPITPVMPVWPGDPPVDLVQVSAIAQGDSANVSRLTMSVHTGTHIDAPKHFIEDGNSVDQIPLTKLIGPVLVIEIDPHINVISEHVLKAHPEIAKVNKLKKVLFRTRNSNLWRKTPHSFMHDYVGINASGAS
jgi:arylformamidase